MRVTLVRVTTVRVTSGLPIPLHRDAAGSAQSHLSTSRCSASCDVPLSPPVSAVSLLFSHPPPLGTGHVVPCHWLHPALNQEPLPLPCSPLAVCPGGWGCWQGQDHVPAPQCGKRGCAMKQRAAGSFSYKQCNEDTLSVETSFTGKQFHMMQLPATAREPSTAPELPR